MNILGVGATPQDLDVAVATLDRWRAERRQEYVCVVSVHGLVVAQRDPVIWHALNHCGIATEDGMPLVWWSRLAGFPQARRVCGSDLLDEVCAFGVPHKFRHYFYGASPKVVEQLIDRLQKRHPGLCVAGYRSPPFRPLTPAEDAADIAAINEAEPDFVWVGLGMPKQEKWMVARGMRAWTGEARRMADTSAGPKARYFKSKTTDPSDTFGAARHCRRRSSRSNPWLFQGSHQYRFSPLQTVTERNVFSTSVVFFSNTSNNSFAPFPK